MREAVGVPLDQLTAGVLQLAESAGRNVSAATFAVYARVCGPAMTAREWAAVVDEALATVDGWPSCARLLRILREQRESAADRTPTAEELHAAARRADARVAQGE